jgi:formiminotetrahydrofolate cyclodeaminase
MGIKDKKIQDFLEELSSKSPTPGGGAAAAVTGAMAASLVSMVALLTVGKPKYQKVEGVMKKVAKEAKKISRDLMALADKDVAAFDRVMRAYKAKKRTSIIRSLKGATTIPLKVIRLSKRVGTLALLVAEKGNKNAFSDAKSALHLANAAAKAADENVRINTKALAKLK